MADIKEKDAEHVEFERSASTKDMAVSPVDGRQVNVLSVALTDAIAKDRPQYLSWSMFRLYGIMLLTTLSMDSPTSSRFIVLTSIVAQTAA